jgi:hypothetical protein
MPDGKLDSMDLILSSIVADIDNAFKLINLRNSQKPKLSEINKKEPSIVL